MKTYTCTVFVPADTRGYGENLVKLPALDARVELTVDLDRIAIVLGRKAARSKGKKSHDLGGLVKAKVLDTKQIS